MESNINSVRALSDFIERLPEMWPVNFRNYKNLKFATNMLLLVNHDDVSFESINADETVENFIAKTGSKIGDSSKGNYKSRIKQVISLYKSYLSDPAGFLERKNKAVKFKNNSSCMLSLSLQQHPASSASTFDIPIPIRDGLILTIPNIPADITEEEADHIAEILKAYAQPE